jgi:hypothetical protein
MRDIERLIEAVLHLQSLRKPIRIIRALLQGLRREKADHALPAVTARV